MKNFMPLAVMQAAKGSELTTASVAKNGLKSAEKAVSSGFSDALSGIEAAFHESLAGLLSTENVTSHTGSHPVAGGKSLPVTGSAAITGLIAPVSEAIDAGVQSETALVNGLPVDAPLSAPGADVSSMMNGIRQLSKLIAQTSPQQVVGAGADNMAQPADRATTVEQMVTAQADQSQGKPVSLLSAEASMVRMHRGQAEVSLTQEPLNRDAPGKVGLGQTLSDVDATDVQPHNVKAEPLLNESDRMFTSRIQLLALSPITESAVPRSASDTLPGSAEALQAALSRTSISQPGAFTDSPATSAQSMITETLGRSEWGQGMGRQILWMVNQNVSRAEIRLNPANLGPLEVRVEMDNDQVNVAFTSRHADVRDAVELSLPRLREMLEEKGLNLANTDISDHSFAEQQRGFGGANDHSNDPAFSVSFVRDDAIPDDSGLTTGPLSGVASTLSEGMVDYYI